MQKRNARTLTVAKTTSTVSSTIDNILNRGAEKLYERYITAKIPVHMNNDFHQTIRNIFNPLEKSREQEKGTILTVHESAIEKIHLVDEKHRSKNSFSSIKQYPERVSDQFAKSFHLKQHSQQTRGTSRKKTRKAVSHSKQAEKDLKEFLSSQLTECPKKSWFDNEATSEDEHIWAEKQDKNNKQRIKQEQVRQQLEKGTRIKKRLEEQFRQLEQDNRSIPFDYETGRLIQPSEHHVHDTPKRKENIIFLNYNCFDTENNHFRPPPKESSVTSTRKITTFTRPKRKRIVIDEDMNECDYNNNGKRQNSSIPFLDIQEGVLLKEDNGNVSDHKQRHNSSRVQSASMTHRTFKSYSKEIIQSNQFGKTICTVSAKKWRYDPGEDSKETKKSYHGSKRESILWKNHRSMKDHTITKNPQLIQNYFQLREPLAQ